MNEERGCRWLLNKPEKALDHHAFHLQTMKHGTGGDLMHGVLSVTTKSATKREPTSGTCITEISTCTIEVEISRVGEFLNHKLHDLTSTMIENNKREPFDYQTLDIDDKWRWYTQQ